MEYRIESCVHGFYIVMVSNGKEMYLSNMCNGKISWSDKQEYSRYYKNKRSVKRALDKVKEA